MYAVQAQTICWPDMYWEHENNWEKNNCYVFLLTDQIHGFGWFGQKQWSWLMASWCSYDWPSPAPTKGLICATCADKLGHANNRVIMYSIRIKITTSTLEAFFTRELFIQQLQQHGKVERCNHSRCYTRQTLLYFFGIPPPIQCVVCHVYKAHIAQYAGHRQSIFMQRQVMFGQEKLGLVHFDAIFFLFLCVNFDIWEGCRKKSGKSMVFYHTGEGGEGEGRDTTGNVQ